jgi:hypothetical protein
MRLSGRSACFLVFFFLLLFSLFVGARSCFSAFPGPTRAGAAFHKSALRFNCVWALNFFNPFFLLLLLLSFALRARFFVLLALGLARVRAVFALHKRAMCVVRPFICLPTFFSIVWGFFLLLFFSFEDVNEREAVQRDS